MFTRRTAITLLPAGVMAGSHFTFANFALAQTAVDSIKPDPNAAARILKELEAYQNGPSAPYYDAAAPMIRFFARVAGRGDLSKASKSDLREMLSDLKNINDISNVDHVLTMAKKSEAQLGRGLLSLDDKNRLMNEINGQNDKLQQILDKYFGASGTLDSNPISKSDRDTLKQLADEVLKRGCKLATWGRDAFYAAARGYCAYQFVSGVVKDSIAPPATARAYVLGIMADSHNYFALLSYSASPPTPTQPAPAPSTSSAPSTDPLYEYEKQMTNRFPREIYFGSEYGNKDTNKCSFDQFANYYGKIDGNFDQGFRIAEPGGWTQDCGELNNKSVGALSGQLSDRFRDFAPRSGNSENLRVVFDRVIEALNGRVARIKRQKQERDKASGTTSSAATSVQNLPDSDKNDLLPEFKALERMAWGLREMLSKA